MDSSNIKLSKIRIAIIAGLVFSLLYLTGCCNQQQQGQAADGGRKPTKGILKADKPQDLPAQTGATGAVGGEATTNGDQQAQTGAETATEVVNNIPGPVDPAGAGLTPGNGDDDVVSTENTNIDETAEGEDTPSLSDEEKASKIDTEELE